MKLDFRNDNIASRNVLVLEITWDDGTYEEHADLGEAGETYGERWDWVDRALDRAYREGYKAGRSTP